MPQGISLHLGLNAVDPNHYQDGDGRPWAGELNACENDARCMADLAKAQGFTVHGPLLTSEATTERVMAEVRSIAQQLQAGDMFLLTYSGHGGQVENKNPDDDPEEDSLDETWCLYDREFLDDELFALFTEFRSGVRVVVFSDSCHSGTVSRGEPEGAHLPDEFATPKQLPVDVAQATEQAHADLYTSVQRDVPTKRLAPLAATVVLLSGCQDHQFSRDGRLNGAFTGALLQAWEDQRSRRSLPDLLKATAAGIPTSYEQEPNYSVHCFDVCPPLVI
jgi:hypothetical protein